MADAPSGSDATPSQYWCNHCSKYASIESLFGAVICQDCRHRLPEFISAASRPPSPSPPPPDRDLQADIDFANVELDDEFFRIYNLIAEAGREDGPPSPPSPPSPPFEFADASEYDYLRLDLGGWEIDEVFGDIDPNQSNNESNQEGGNENLSRLDRVTQIENEDGNSRENESNNREGGRRRRRPFLLRPVIENHSRRRRRAALGLDDLGARAGTRRHRVVQWADNFGGSEEHSIEVRLQLPEADTYFGNPGDYMDAAGYEAFLRVLAERDNGGNRGAPPAAKSIVMRLETVVITAEEEVMVCVVCRDSVNVGELVKKLPCRHGYHADCIVQWLKLRNSCPVCRFELPTDDPEYESERNKKLNRTDVVDGSTSDALARVAGGSSSGTVERSYNSMD